MRRSTTDLLFGLAASGALIGGGVLLFTAAPIAGLVTGLVGLLVLNTSVEKAVKQSEQSQMTPWERNAYSEQNSYSSSYDAPAVKPEVKRAHKNGTTQTQRDAYDKKHGVGAFRLNQAKDDRAQGFETMARQRESQALAQQRHKRQH